MQGTIDTLATTGASREQLRRDDTLTWEEALDALLENVDGLGHVKAANVLRRSPRLRPFTERIIATGLERQS